MGMIKKINSAHNGEVLNKCGLEISQSFLDQESKNSLFDEIEKKRKTLFLTTDAQVEFNFDESEYYHIHQEKQNYID